jgi:predicted nucleotidyltransferase
LTEEEKTVLKQELVSCLSCEQEISKIIIFGSFLRSDDPHDMDVAVFQDSQEDYLALAMKYSRKTRAISRRIPLEIFPVKNNLYSQAFLSLVQSGEVIYEKA